MTLPVETGQEDVVLDLAKRWRADALRDSDGTTMPDSLTGLGTDIYSVACLVRADQEFAHAHPEYLHRKYLMSFPVTAFHETVVLRPLDGYSKDKYELDVSADPKFYWEVRDRTAGVVVDPDCWRVDAGTGAVTVEEATPHHEYTVSFLARQIWDSVSMYNALTNDWEGPRIRSVDPYHPECRAHLKEVFARWLDAHPATTVVRFTTFAYLFVIDSGERNQDIYRDWTGYGETVSPEALNDFEKRFGYRLTPEDFVDAGYYNGTYKVPSPRYRDWMTFVCDFVADFSGELVEMAHRAGKRAAMFQGDHWIGTEPFLPSYQRIGIDINVGAVEDGVALRRLTDSPGPQVREARFYPYFFPDVFREGNDPVVESLSNWRKIRRAMLRSPLHRIGYGGYLSLAAKFPKFIDHVEALSAEFGSYLEAAGGTESWKHPFKVAVLNAWGAPRAWLQNQCREQRFHVPSRPDVMELVGHNVLECLSGLPFEVVFLSLEEVAREGIPDDVGVVINSGDANSAWSGGDWWSRPEVCTEVRRFVAKGGGFLGCIDPSAHLGNGRYFQLGDVMGLEKETGLTMGRVAAPVEPVADHPLSRALTGEEEFSPNSYVYPQSDDIEVIVARGQHLAVTAHAYHEGRGAYLSGLPFRPANARFLEGLLIWLSGRELSSAPFFSNNPDVDVAWYPETGRLALANMSPAAQTVSFRDLSGEANHYDLAGDELRWEPFNA